MVSLAALWLPIVVSAVVVFIASSIMHMVLPYHRTDYSQIPDEDKILAPLGTAALKPGLYVFPFCQPKDFKKPETMERYRRGPVGMMTIVPNAPPAMPKFLGMWFGFCLVVSFFVAYLAGHTLAPGTNYLAVFRVVGTASFLAHGLSRLSDGIWKGGRWGTVIKEVIDGLVYGLLTAGVFGWLWPR